MTPPPRGKAARAGYLDWREPRVGTANPERMTNRYWATIFEKRMSGYAANAHYGGPSSFGSKPAWAADRFGQTTTELPDGRTLFVAGEHEDSYDPDFYIYNDVIVKLPGGKLEFYGYPREIFPPTDFHTATLVGQRLLLVGNLGYAPQRKPRETQVLALDVNTLAVSALSTTGTPPGWIHNHEASLEAGGIVVTRGLLSPEGEGGLVENVDDWRLDLGTLCWERLTLRDWPRWELRPDDGMPCHLWTIGHTKWTIDHQFGEWEQAREALIATLGGMPDLGLFDALYQPPVPFTARADREDDAFGTKRIEIDGVVVRYVEGSYNVRLTVEGELPPAKVEVVVEDLRAKISALELRRWVSRRL